MITLLIPVNILHGVKNNFVEEKIMKELNLKYRLILCLITTLLLVITLNRYELYYIIITVITVMVISFINQYIFIEWLMKEHSFNKKFSALALAFFTILSLIMVFVSLYNIDINFKNLSEDNKDIIMNWVIACKIFAAYFIAGACTRKRWQPYL